MTIHLKIVSAALLSFSVSAQAAVTITIEEVGSDVVVIGSGSIDSLNGLEMAPFAGWATGTYGLVPSSGAVIAANTQLVAWRMEIEASNFGSGSIATTENVVFENGGFALMADARVIGGYQSIFGLPDDHTLGDPIGFQLTYENQTLDSLGIDAGEHRWEWGTPEDGDYITLTVTPTPAPPAPTSPTPVPTLGAFGLMGLAGTISTVGIAMNRRRKQ